jgi:hypothetical protein
MRFGMHRSIGLEEPIDQMALIRDSSSHYDIDRGTKSEVRNPKQIRNPNSRMFKTNMASEF